MVHGVLRKLYTDCIYGIIFLYGFVFNGMQKALYCTLSQTKIFKNKFGGEKLIFTHSQSSLVSKLESVFVAPMI